MFISVPLKQSKTSSVRANFYVRIPGVRFNRARCVVRIAVSSATNVRRRLFLMFVDERHK